MTNQEAIKINDKCSNGFKLDVAHYIFHKEKQLVKEIPLTENTFLKVNLSFFPEYMERENFSRQRFNVPTGNIVPTLWYNICKNEGNVSVSHGLGYTKTIGTPTERKSIANLCKLTTEFTDEKLMEIWNEFKK